MACGVFENSVRRDKDNNITKVVHEGKEIDLTKYDKQPDDYEVKFLDKLQEKENIFEWRSKPSEKSLGLWSRSLLDVKENPFKGLNDAEKYITQQLIKQGEIEIQCK